MDHEKETNHKGLRVFVAIMLGIALGTITANHWGVFWWVGSFIGGAVGYLAYDLKYAGKVIVNDWKKTVALPKCHFKALFFRMFAVTFLFVSFGCVFLVPAALVSFILGVPLIKGPSYNYIIELSHMFSFCLVCGILSGYLEAQHVNPEEDFKETKLFFLYTNPITVCIGWPLYGLYKLIVHFKVVAKWIWNFICAVIREIHCDERLLCFSFSLLGVALCYTYQIHFLIGAVAGGLLGFAYYKLLSERVVAVLTR